MLIINFKSAKEGSLRPHKVITQQSKQRRAVLIPGHPWSLSEWKYQSAHEQLQSGCQLLHGLLLALQSMQEVFPRLPTVEVLSHCPPSPVVQQKGAICAWHQGHKGNDACKKFWKGRFSLCRNRGFERATA